MSAQTVARIGPACGIIFVVTLFAGSSAESPQAELAGLALFIPFVAHLASLVGGALGLTIAGAGAAGITLKIASAVPWVSREAHAEGSATYTALEDMAVTATVTMMYPLAILTATVALVALATEALPRWIGLVSALTTVALLANAMTLHAEFVYGLLAFLAWTLAVAVRLLVRPAAVTREAVVAV